MRSTDQEFKVFCPYCGIQSQLTMTARDKDDAKQEFFKAHGACIDGITRTNPFDLRVQEALPE